ncbi:hypothetical protein ACSVIJ_07035 [Pseudomonas sp. NCHU5208]|uniref:hypothetical protein n=1 Tax=unclassified Pseudomonas TaxID=196821 RepID=UPI003F99301E
MAAIGNAQRVDESRADHELWGEPKGGAQHHRNQSFVLAAVGRLKPIFQAGSMPTLGHVALGWRQVMCDWGRQLARARRQLPMRAQGLLKNYLGFGFLPRSSFCIHAAVA